MCTVCFSEIYVINFVRKYLKMKEYFKNLLFSNARSWWRSPLSIHSLRLCYKMHKKSFDNKKVSTCGWKNTSNLKKKQKWVREKLFDCAEETWRIDFKDSPWNWMKIEEERATRSKFHFTHPKSLNMASQQMDAELGNLTLKEKL